MNKLIYKHIIISTVLSVPLALVISYILVTLISTTHKTDVGENLGLLLDFFLAGFFSFFVSTVLVSVVVYFRVSHSMLSTMTNSKKLLIIFTPFFILETVFAVLTGVGFIIIPPLLIIVFVVYLSNKVWKSVQRKLNSKTSVS